MNATLTLPVLTAEDITRLMADSRTRGEYKTVISDFVKSGELAIDLTVKFNGKAASAIRQSVNGNIEKHGAAEKWPTLKVLLKDNGEGQPDTAILVNMDAHAAAVAAQTTQV